MTRPILALKFWLQDLQIEQVKVAEINDGPLTLALCSLHFLSASQILFSSKCNSPLKISFDSLGMMSCLIFEQCLDALKV